MDGGDEIERSSGVCHGLSAPVEITRIYRCWQHGGDWPGLRPLHVISVDARMGVSPPGYQTKEIGLE